MLHYSEVRLDGAPVSCALDFTRNGEILSYMSTFDLGYKSFSPGNVQTALNAKWGCENGLAALDFMQGEEAYKFHWADKVHETVSYAIAARTAYPVWAWNTKLRKMIVEYKV